MSECHKHSDIFFDRGFLSVVVLLSFIFQADESITARNAALMFFYPIRLAINPAKHLLTRIRLLSIQS